MKNFRLLQAQIDTIPLLAEIAASASAFDAHRGRQEKVKVQREALAIPLRGLRVSAIGERERRDVHESRWTSGSQAYPLARAFLKKMARKLDGELSRAKIVCLPPGHRVYPHIDRGEYYRLRNRYHLVLKSSGSWMCAGEEEVRMRTGELWWFDNDQLHEARNDGDDDRIHLIFDLLPRARAAAVTDDDAARVLPKPDAKVH
ncbi:aspartyl/asparaginyl beta-hydroxylase domain-containing protein [Porphyrobacter sp. YT40]|uniref:aspartyl/asparaginyl beta-hydroxylase domain-containing protein n=1 Tax=Porphyrobacter sp. YT40 TaxID=2547601 RepID=UPI001142E02C|nr:aspartyl/asparaginyl beta-hydroxylase domain-containing protein [Porphyrobacter sp. YT40]QDH35252.1 aspartyl/asparaginyl beta-hydroxylase domain-containing protein [Porphyrobacter sp. YT40]